MCLTECSAINRHFWKSICSHVQTLAPTALTLADPAPLLTQLRGSGKLKRLCGLMDVGAGAGAEWTCTAASNGDEGVIVFLLPRRLYCPASGRKTGEGGVALIPIILLQCCQAQLLNSDLTDTPPPEDIYLRFDMTTTPPPELVKMAPSLRDLLTQLSSLHSSCYLEQLHSALTCELSVCEQDLLRGMEVCKTSILSVDMTPLLSGLCQHSLTSLPPSTTSSNTQSDTYTIPLPPHLLCQLLSATLSKLTWTCAVQLTSPSSSSCGGVGLEEGGTSEGPLPCQLHTEQINQAFREHLSQLGFREVPHCGPTHFWLDSCKDARQPQVSASEVCGKGWSLTRGLVMQTQVSQMSLTLLPATLISVEEESHSGDSGAAMSESGSSEEDQDMVLMPLLSPPAEDLSEGTGTSGVPSPPPPLFMRVVCALRDSAGLKIQEVSPSNPTHTLSTCLSECCAVHQSCNLLFNTLSIPY